MRKYGFYFRAQPEFPVIKYFPDIDRLSLYMHERVCGMKIIENAKQIVVLERWKDQLIVKPVKEVTDQLIRNNLLKIMNNLGNNLLEGIRKLDVMYHRTKIEEWEPDIEKPDLIEFVISERNLIYLARIVTTILKKNAPKQMEWSGGIQMVQLR
jgi:hypothetical protein